MKKRVMRLLSICMAAALTATSVLNVSAAEVKDTNFMQSESTAETEKVISSPILITEIVPNTDNMNKLDAYEYYELTNISEKDVDLSNYNIVYVNGTKTSIWKADVNVIPAGQSMVVWIRNDGNQELTKTDFLNYYNLAEDALVAEVSCDGLANSKRTLAIADREGNVLLSQEYNSEDSGDATIDINEAIVFTYVGNEITLKYDQVPSPLTVAEGDIVGVYVEPETDEEDDTTEDSNQDVNVDQTKAPVLLITEIIPDTTNINGSDGYEFIEIYNNSDVTINLKEYKLCYSYPDTGVVTTWWETEEDRNLTSGESLVFWVLNGANNDLTIEDFNEFYNVSLTEDQLIQIECGGLANSSYRGVSIYTNVGDEIEAVFYNNNVDNTEKDLSIIYQNQYEDGVFETVMMNDKAAPTPGTITEEEKAEYAAKVTVPTSVPVVTDQTVTEFSNETTSLDYTIEAVSEETTIKTVKLYHKYNGQETFECTKVERNGENTFTKTFTNVDLLNKSGFTYYFEVSDGWNTAKTEEKIITNTDAVNASTLNVKEGDVLTDTHQIISYGEQLLIDGADVSGEAKASINGVGKLAFEATDTDVFFKNAVAVGENVIGIFNEGTYSDVRTYVYDIDAGMFDKETMTITVEFHAGNKANALEHNIENNDDFTIRNIRLVLPNGRTITPVSYQAKKGLGVVEHENMDAVEKIDLNIASQSTNISMGDGTSKYEIVYANFQLEESDFEAIRYVWDTTKTIDGEHSISNGTQTVNVYVDNTPPEIVTNIEDQKEYRNETIEVTAADALSSEVSVAVTLDGKKIDVPYTFRALEMEAGEHVLHIVSQDHVGNMAEKEIIFTTLKESPDISDEIFPENGAVVTTAPELSVKVTDASNDEMTVTFKEGNRYVLGDANIASETGVSDESGTAEDVYDAESGNGFPYECFDIVLDENVTENTVVNVKWSGRSNNEKTFMYIYNTASEKWEQVDAKQTVNEDEMILEAEIGVTDHLVEGKLKVLVQNGEGYTPVQYAEGAELVSSYSINVTDPTTPTYNVDDTPRDEYDFTFAVESDTQYYNEDYDGNENQSQDGIYQHQLNIHNWLLANRTRMNIQYLFHDGDIIDDSPNIGEWEKADAAYKILDEAELPYGILAGNHDVGHLDGNYDNYTTYFGENRYSSNPWYGESYKNNRGHYDLITVGGIDFIMVYMGWGIGDEEIEWMNHVLAQYPERKAILNFHEYLLASGGLGEEPQRIHDEVVAVNENVCMVLSGHYHNARTRIDTFTNTDGSTRYVYNMLFDYQGLVEGGAGYLRLMHFDLEGEKVTVRTFSPSYGGSDLSNYGDYDVKVSDVINEGNAFVVEGASLNDAEHFTIPFAELGIMPEVKTLETTGLEVDVYNESVIGVVAPVLSGEEASYVWENASNEVHGWYAEVTDEYGGLTRTNVHYVEVNRETEIPVEPPVEENEVVRIAGEGRIDTALEVADTLKVTLGLEKFDTVIIATSKTFADALPGSYLAYVENAPILLISDARMDDVVAYVKANLVDGGKVYILGGEAAVSPELEGKLEGYTVDRLAGAGRYETNMMILDRAGVTGGEIIVATGKTFADSLSASAAKLPILMVKDSLNADQKAMLETMNVEKFYIVGGESAVSAAVADELAVYAEVERVAGANRRETSIAIAQKFSENPEVAVVASASNFPDGLCGGPLAAALNAPLILTVDNKTDEAAAYTTDLGIEAGYVLGGTGVLKDDSVVNVFALESAEDIIIK